VSSCRWFRESGWW